MANKYNIRLIIAVGTILFAIAGGWFTLKSDVEAMEDAYADVKETPKQIAVINQKMDDHIKNFDEFKDDSEKRDDKMIDLLYEIRRNGNGTNN